MRALGGLVPVLVALACRHGTLMQPIADPRASCRTVVASGGVETPKVRWFGPIRDNDVIKNDSWCRAVGPALMRGSPLRSQSTVDSLAIVSWNVAIGAGDVITFVRDLRHGVYTDGHPVEQFVLLAQETFRQGADVPASAPRDASARGKYDKDANGNRYDIASLADSLGLFVAYAPSMRNGAGFNRETRLNEDRGNAVLSTMPLQSLAVVELPNIGQRRAALLTHIEGIASDSSEWRLQVGSIHLDIGRWYRSPVSTGRARQARAIMEVVDTQSVVIAGDLNLFNTVDSTEKALDLLRAAFPQTQQGDTLETHDRPEVRIDYQFYRLPRRITTVPYCRLPSRYGSDHFPLLGWVFFIPSTGGPRSRSCLAQDENRGRGSRGQVQSLRGRPGISSFL